MERYTITEAAHALGISLLTLREWLDRAGVQPTPDKYDQRRKWIATEQLILLANAHERTVRSQMTLNEALARIAELEAENRTLKANRTHYTTTSQTYDNQTSLSPIQEIEARRTSVTKHRQPQASQPEKTNIKRNQEGEYHFGEDGLTYDEQGLLTARGFASIAEEHGAKYETARQAWAKACPNSMRISRTLAVQWMLTNRRSYLLTRCNVSECPCHNSSGLGETESTQ